MKSKDTKAKTVLSIGIISLLISLLAVETSFTMFLFFFVIFSICFIYSRKIIFITFSKSIIKKICNLKNKKKILQKNVYSLELQYKHILENINNQQANIDKINEYRKIINTLITEKKKLNIEIIKLEDKKRNIERITEHEELINRAIKEEEKTFNMLSEQNQELEEKKKKIVNEINVLREKVNPIKEQIAFINNCNINKIDQLEGFEFEDFCVNLLKIDGYEYIQHTQKSFDYGIDIIAEKDNMKCAIQCKRYNGKIGNDAIQEALAGKVYYDCDIAIVLTNSTFTNSAKKLSKSTSVILWDRNTLLNIIERNKKRLL